MPWEFSLPIYPSLRADRDSATVRSGKLLDPLLGDRRHGVGPHRRRAGVPEPRAVGTAGAAHRAGADQTSLTSSVVDLKIFSHTMTGAVQESSTLPISGTTDWVNVIVETDVPKDTYEVWVWLMYDGAGAGARLLRRRFVHGAGARDRPADPGAVARPAQAAARREVDETVEGGEQVFFHQEARRLQARVGEDS